MTAESRILIGDVRATLRSLPDASVHMAVTSTPYWSLRSYLPKDHPDKPLEIGSEPTMAQHIETMVGVMREVRRVLRDDGTLWLNYGDCYGGGKCGGGSPVDARTDGRPTRESDRVRGREDTRDKIESEHGGQLLGLPWRLAFALQDDGWILRSAIVWAKGCSFRPEWSGSVMPESVSGWRFERCRVKVAPGRVARHGVARGNGHVDESNVGERVDGAKRSDCPGCPKCSPNNGYVLRRGSWRPTSAYEMLFLFAKSADYYCDGEAVKEAGMWGESDRQDAPRGSFNGKHDSDASATNGSFRAVRQTRNLRNVWTIGTSPSDVPHYATYPPELVEPCIKAGTSDKGVCPHCGAPWARVVDKTTIRRERPNDRTDWHKSADAGHGTGNRQNSCGNTVAGVDTRTIGCRPTCSCAEHAPVPATVLDPFLGSGTTAIVARRLGRSCIGCELNETYADIARHRIGEYAPLFLAEATA